MKKIAIFLLLSIICMAEAFASSGFVARKIQIIGLQRISRGTVLSYLPVRAGERVTTSDTNKIIDALYSTNFFTDVELLRRADILIIKVKERPTIGALHISGNKKIPTKQLVIALKKLGFTEGEVFDRSTLTELKQGLLQQYYNLGRYNARIDMQVSKAERNRVIVNINIHEGATAKIKSIQIIGNRHFTAEQLTHDFSLTTPNMLSWITNSDQYSRMKLDADLEKLNSYYLNRGFLRFKINSTQVSITPDRSSVYIVIHVTEGPVYRISGFEVSGNLLGRKQQVLDLIDLKQGAVFSRQKLMAINDKIHASYGDIGYAFAKVNPIPKINDKNNTVNINFVINPGKKIYVRRINFYGNAVTAEYVFRRELRQLEGGLYNLKQINESKRNLSNLPFVKGVDMKLKPVSGHPNQADMDYTLKETSAAAISANVGYSDAEGFIYGASLNDGNFMGTGKTIGFQFNGSAYQKSYSFNYFNPYFTANKIGFGYSVYYNHTTPAAVNLSSYTTDTVGTSLRWSYPISEYSSVYLGPGFEYTELKTSTESPSVAKKFVKKHGHYFQEYKINGGWNYSNLDRYIFPTKGFTTGIDLTAAVPATKKSLEYYQAQYNIGFYAPLSKFFIFHPYASFGYGNGYGRYKSNLPFFEHYYAGGIGSVRGFEPNSLGPKDQKTGDSIGGNILTTGTAAIIFPNPLGDSVRTSLFVDAGNVYDGSVRLKELRYSTGMQVEWRTPIAPLVFSLATPLNKHKGDDVSIFNFSIGASF